MADRTFTGQIHRGFDLEEASLCLYPTFDVACAASVPFVAPLLASAVRAGLANGRYIVKNGIVVLAHTMSNDEPVSPSTR